MMVLPAETTPSVPETPPPAAAELPAIVLLSRVSRAEFSIPPPFPPAEVLAILSATRVGYIKALPSEELAVPLRAVLSGHSVRESRELQAVNRRGRAIVCQATVLPLLGQASGDGAPVRGAIVMMEDHPAMPEGDGRR